MTFSMTVCPSAISNILIYSPNLQDHILHLQIILEVLHTKKFFAKLSKCSFVTSQVSYLGIISVEGVAPDPENVIAMVSSV